MSMQLQDNREIVQNLRLIQQVWMGLFIKMNQLATVMQQIEVIYEPIITVIAEFCDDPFEEELPAAYESLLFDGHDFNRILLGMKADLKNRHPTIVGDDNPWHYTWDPVESTPLHPAKPVTHGNNQLSLYDRVLDFLIQRAQDYLKRCQRVHRGIAAVQRRFKSRHYAPDAPGARRAQKNFESQHVAVV